MRPFWSDYNKRSYFARITQGDSKRNEGWKVDLFVNARAPMKCNRLGSIDAHNQFAPQFLPLRSCMPDCPKSMTLTKLGRGGGRAAPRRPGRGNIENTSLLNPDRTSFPV